MAQGVVKTTLLDLVEVLSGMTTSDAEVVAVAASLINSGKVQLCGNFAGARIDPSLCLSPVYSDLWMLAFTRTKVRRQVTKA